MKSYTFTPSINQLFILLSEGTEGFKGAVQPEPFCIRCACLSWISAQTVALSVCCCLSLCVGPTDWACIGGDPLAVVLVNKKPLLRAALGWAACIWLWGCSSISEKLWSFSDAWTISALIQAQLIIYCLAIISSCAKTAAHVLNMNSWTTTNAAAEKLTTSNLHLVSNTTEVFPSLLIISHYLYYFINFCPQGR